MNTRKNLTISFISVMIVLIALSGFWQLGAAKSGIVRLVAGETIGVGWQGLHVSNIPHGVTHVYLDNVGTNLPSHFIHKLDMKYRAPAMEVRFLNAKGGEVEKVNALIYVYFKVSQSERDMWLKGSMENIAIWFANEQTGSWEMCPTYLVDQSRGSGTVGCLTCLAPGSGFFVLGQGEFGKYLPKTAVSSNMVNSYSGMHPTILTVRAYIDGRSQLIIKDNMIYWHHLDFAAPGRHFDAEVSQPTYLNQANWLPIWPDVPDSENRDCNCDSSTYEGIPNLAKTNQTVWLDVVQGRGAVYVLQQPDAANNYTLIVELDDNPLMGPDWYEVKINYASEAAN